MITNLRELTEQHLAITLEGQWSLPVNLVSPEGVRTDGLRAQILYDITRINPETGETIVVGTPVVTLRRSTLVTETRIPAPGENWLVEIPVDPEELAAKQQMVLSPVHPPEGGRSVGFIRLYLQQVEQS